MAVAGPLLLLLLSWPPPAASGDVRKSGERAGTDGRHPGGTGVEGRERLGGVPGIVTHLEAPVRSPGAGTVPRSSPWVVGSGRYLACASDRGGKDTLDPSSDPRAGFGQTGPLESALPSLFLLPVRSRPARRSRAGTWGWRGPGRDSAWIPAARPLKRRIRQCDYSGQGHLVWEKGQSWEKVAWILE